jgi:hypothetical protein
MLNVCDVVYYGMDCFGRKRQAWRVTQCYKKQSMAEYDLLYPIDCDVLREIIELERLKKKYTRQEQNLPTNNCFRLIPCVPEEATHVGLSAVCGATAPIEECEFIEVVQWSKELIESQQEAAKNRINWNLHYYEWQWE